MLFWKTSRNSSEQFVELRTLGNEEPNAKELFGLRRWVNFLWQEIDWKVDLFNNPADSMDIFFTCIFGPFCFQFFFLSQSLIFIFLWPYILGLQKSLWSTFNKCIRVLFCCYSCPSSVNAFRPQRFRNKGMDCKRILEQRQQA